MISWTTVEGEGTYMEAPNGEPEPPPWNKATPLTWGGQKNPIPGDTGVTHADIDYGLA